MKIYVAEMVKTPPEFTGFAIYGFIIREMPY
jgi:hypothetical protein